MRPFCHIDGFATWDKMLVRPHGNDFFGRFFLPREIECLGEIRIDVLLPLNQLSFWSVWYGSVGMERYLERDLPR